MKKGKRTDKQFDSVDLCQFKIKKVHTMDPMTIYLLDRIIQWLVIPLLMGFVWLSKQSSKHDKEIYKILTILEERNKMRDEDLKRNQEVQNNLYLSMEKLSTRIDNLLENLEKK